MSFADNILKKLFGPIKPEQSGKRTLIEEQIKRNEKFLAEYATWRRSERWLTDLQTIRNIYDNPTQNNSARFDSAKGAGLRFQCPNDWDNKRASFVLDYLKERMKEQEYVLQHHKHKVSESGDLIEESELYYLKPIPKIANPPISQRFGNVHLELAIKNNNERYIKIQSNYYSDRNYLSPIPFAELMATFFSIGG